MTEYSVRVTDSALSAIAEQARFIAVDSQAPLNAQRWLEAIWDAVDSLERLPRRGSLARESDYVEDEVRQLVIGHHLLLYAIDDQQHTVGSSAFVGGKGSRVLATWGSLRSSQGPDSRHRSQHHRAIASGLRS